MKMKIKTSVVFLLVLVARSMSQDVDSSNLGQDILEDIYNIYNVLPLTLDEILNITVSPNDIGFYLFSNNDTNNYTLVGPNNSSVVNKDAPILFLIHGWLDNRTVEWYQLFTESFFALNSSYNVIQVDWSKYTFINYVSASYCVTDVGIIIGEYISTLIQNYSIPVDNILIIGHSLGSQVASYIGRTVQNRTDESLPRIIANDPAGPLFEGRPDDQRLNPTVANVVEVVHSNGGVFGYLDSCGTIDFFLNDGTVQPGCVREALSNISEIGSFVTCAHSRSYEVLDSAIRNRGHFEARKCDSWLQYSLLRNSCADEIVDLGNITTTETGNFYLNTTGTAPYYEE